MTTRQPTIAHWHGDLAAFNTVERACSDEALNIAYGTDNFIEEIDATCPHDVGVFIGYDSETGEQMWKCHQCGEVSRD